MRRKRAELRSVLPDPRYHSETVAKFINNVMERGKKSLAASVVYSAFEVMEERTKRPALEVFEEALKNATPMVEVKPRRVGGATYQIPVEISATIDRAGDAWLITSARNRSGRDMAARLAAELLDAARNEGGRLSGARIRTGWQRPTRRLAHFRYCRRRSLGAGGVFVPTSRAMRGAGRTPGQPLRHIAHIHLTAAPLPLLIDMISPEQQTVLLMCRDRSGRCRTEVM